MQAELFMIGTELLLGQVQDTNATYMAQLLAENGINLYQKTTVGDNPSRIQESLRAALQRSDVILCSGGLGPTEDDITRDCVAQVFSRSLVYHEALYESVLARFRRGGFKITENNKKQAMLPEGAEVIENPHGTAPGFVMAGEEGIVICMPGVPKELKPMLEERVLPWLRERFGLEGVLHYRVLKVCGMGESRVDSLIGDLIQAQENPSIGLLASPDAVRIRIAARAKDVAHAEALIAPVAQAVEARLPGRIMGYNEDTLEGVVGALLEKRGWTVVVGESLSGGSLSRKLSLAAQTSFAGGRIWPMTRFDAQPAAEEAFDLARALLLDFPANCSLVLLGRTEDAFSVAVLVTPEERVQWEIAHYGNPARNQERLAMATLERLRQYLMGDQEIS